MRDPTRLEQTSDGHIDRKVFKVVRANEGKLHKSLHNQAPLSVPNERVDEDQLELSEDELEMQESMKNYISMNY